MGTHSSILAWKIPWTEDPGRLQSMGSQESDTIQQLNHLTLPNLNFEKSTCIRVMDQYIRKIQQVIRSQMRDVEDLDQDEGNKDGEKKADLR